MNLPSFLFSPQSLLIISALLLYGYLFYKIYSKNQLFRAQMWMLLVLGISFFAGLVIFLPFFSHDFFSFTFWVTVFFILHVFIFPTLLGFVIVFTGKESVFDNLLTKILLYLPSFLLIFVITQTNFIVNHSATGLAALDNFLSFRLGTMYISMYFVWIQLYLAVALGLLVQYSFVARDEIKRKYARLFLLALGAQLLINCILAFVFVHMPVSSFVPDTFFMSLVVGIACGYGILRYNFTSTNPATVASTIVDTMNEVLLVIDHDGKIESANNTATTIIHYTKEELVGKNISILFGNEDTRFKETVLNPIVSGSQQVDIEINVYGKDQKKIPAKIAASAIRGPQDKLEGIVCVVTDITHLRELLNVTEQRNKMSSIIESMYDGVIAFDHDNNVSMVNSSTLNMFNLRKEDVMGKRIEDFLSFMEKEQPFIISDLLPTSNIIHETLITQRKSVKVVSISGKQMFIDLTCSVMKPDAEVNLHGIITLHDLTHEKELEEMKLDFVSMAAHELRTPLTSIRGYLSVILKEYAENLSADQKMMLGRVSISADQLMAIVESLLSVSKIERGIFSVNISEVNWQQFVKQTVNDFQERAKERTIQLHFDEPNLTVSSVAADALRIGEVLNNLLSNAINYTYPGGTVTVNLEEKDGKIVTHIKDTGQGIPKEALPHLFTKFFRVSGRLEKGSKGTGLGLYIAKYIVNLHQGEIWVDSEVGKGSTFSFSLPVITEATKILIDDSHMEKTPVKA